MQEAGMLTGANQFTERKFLTCQMFRQDVHLSRNFRPVKNVSVELKNTAKIYCQ